MCWIVRACTYVAEPPEDFAILLSDSGCMIDHQKSIHRQRNHVHRFRITRSFSDQLSGQDPSSL